jgi:glycine betaine/proline transport system substrate-binding protein
LKKAVHEDFPKTHPDAAAAFKNVTFSTSNIGAMAALVDVDGMTHEDAAKKWLADNESVWKPFIK